MADSVRVSSVMSIELWDQLSDFTVTTRRYDEYAGRLVTDGVNVIAKLFHVEVPCKAPSLSSTVYQVVPPFEEPRRIHEDGEREFWAVRMV